MTLKNVGFFDQRACQEQGFECQTYLLCYLSGFPPLKHQESSCAMQNKTEPYKYTKLFSCNWMGKMIVLNFMNY